LLLDIEPTLGQPLDEGRQGGVAQSAVEGPGFGELNAATGTGLELEIELLRVAAQP